MDGHEAIRKIRQNSRLRGLTVIALSAGVLDHEVEKAMDSGFDYYLSKPVDFGSLLKLLAKLGRIVPLEETVTSAPDSPAADSTTSPHSTDTQPSDETGGDTADVDFDQALRLHDNNQQLLLHLVGEFGRLYGDADQQLQTLIDSQDGVAALRLSHNIAGVAGSFGANRLMAVARQLEHQLGEPDVQLTTLELAPFEEALAQFVRAGQTYVSSHADDANTPAPD